MPFFVRFSLLACLGVAILARATLCQAAPPTGAEIYTAQCASCHGAKGEGTAKHSDPLVGKRTLEGLTAYVVKNMPEGAPEKCVGEEANQVARYIYDSFYSPLAQARNTAPRVALARLTVRQYQNSVADLVGSFSPPGEWHGQHGLKAEFFNSGRRLREEDRVFDRVDSQLQFDRQEAPLHEKLAKDEFSVRWQGGLFAAETGDYEIVIQTRNGARVWVNDPRQPLIDAWVRSGENSEYRETLRLLGGRVVPLVVEFFKAKNDQGAAITLRWKPPDEPEDVIPEHCLYRGEREFPPVFVVRTAFPPDDRSLGWERGSAVSKAWVSATGNAALEGVAHVSQHLPELAGYPADRPADAQRVREFAATFLTRAWRRPLTADEKQANIEAIFAGTGDPAEGAKRVVALALGSPSFLYPGWEDAGAGDDPQLRSHAVASRLALALWDSLPDAPLREAAAAGQLLTREQVAEHARRMLPDLRTRAKLRHFFHTWLEVERLKEQAKDTAKFPGFDALVARDLRNSLDLFLDEVLWNEPADFRSLLTSEVIFTNGRLAQLYGFDLPPEAGFQKISPAGQDRAGVITHPHVMASFAYFGGTSPIHRGVFVTRHLLGRRLRPPPIAVAPLSPDLSPELTTRQRVEVQTAHKDCQSCHALINPLGFSFEQFDGIGRFRTQEQGQNVNVEGSYETLAGEVVKFRGARELANFLAGSEETHTAFIEQMFQHLTKQPVLAYGPEMPEKLRRLFAEQNYNMRELALAIAVEAALGPAAATALPAPAP